MTISASTAAQCRTDAAAPTPMPGHDALLAMTVPLMGHRWQRDRIVLSTNSQERVRAGVDGDYAGAFIHPVARLCRAAADCAGL